MRCEARKIECSDPRNPSRCSGRRSIALPLIARADTHTTFREIFQNTSLCHVLHITYVCVCVHIHIICLKTKRKKERLLKAVRFRCLVEFRCLRLLQFKDGTSIIFEHTFSRKVDFRVWSKTISPNRLGCRINCNFISLCVCMHVYVHVCAFICRDYVVCMCVCI